MTAPSQQIDHLSTVKPKGKIDGKKFSRFFFYSFFCISLVIFVWKRADIFPWIGSCNASGYSDETFLSYCHSPRYGDYEHRAFWLEMEPNLIAPVKKADVLFLGNSRTQYAFSTEAIEAFFQKQPMSHYVFGFGMGSQNFVVEKMAEKFGLRPKAVVINADPFFTDRISGTNESMLDNSMTKKWEYSAKEWLQKLQRKTCTHQQEGVFYNLLCQGNEETLFRNKRNGHWDVRYFRKNKRIAVALDTKEVAATELDKAVQIATQFQQQLQLRPECIILTVTPRTITPLAFGEALAETLGWPGVFPVPENLVTVDDSHLDPDSAFRWSDAFIKQAETILRKCVDQ